MRPARLDNGHGFSDIVHGLVDIVHGLSGHSLDIVHGHPGQSPGSPDGLDNVLSMDSLDFVQSEIEVKAASLEIYIHIFLS